MRKKGDLLKNEALTIILSIIAIGFLIFFAYQLYWMNIAKSEIEKARGALDGLTAKFEILEEKGVVGEEEYTYTAPEDWYLVRQGKGYCRKDNCLCLCKEPGCGELYDCRDMGSVFRLLENEKDVSVLSGDAPFTIILKITEKDTPITIEIENV